MEQYDDLVVQALQAMGSDISYAVAIARSANATANKRITFEIRVDLEAAEAEAHKKCNAEPAFVCKAKAPCGTGDCKFAQGDMALLQIKDTRGLSFRPQLHSSGSYALEAAVSPLRELRARKERSRLERPESGEAD